MSADPRLNVFATPAIRPGASEIDRELARINAQLADLRRENADLRREVRDLRAAAALQVGAGTPAGLSARDGTLYLQTNATLWGRLPVGWRGVSLPLT